MAENEHNPYRDRAIEVRFESYWAAVDAVLSMSADAAGDKAEYVGALARQLAGFSGARLAQAGMEALQVKARKLSGINHGSLSTDERQRLLGRLLELEAIAATAPADTFGHLQLVSGGAW